MKIRNLFINNSTTAVLTLLLICGGLIAFRRYPELRLKVTEIIMPEDQKKPKTERGNYLINPFPDLIMFFQLNIQPSNAKT